VTAAEICDRFDLDKEAWSLLYDDMGPLQFAEALIANRQFLTGIDFIAHALKPREAVWWGCLCLQHACGDDLTERDIAACRAAVQWVLEPTEEYRAAAQAPAEDAGPGSVAGRLAMAAHQTSGPGTPHKAGPAGPDPFAPAKAVAGAIKLASAKCDPVKIAETQRLYAELGISRLAESAGSDTVRIERLSVDEGS
jgi:Family of unknown function (DUF6931)